MTSTTTSLGRPQNDLLLIFLVVNVIHIVVFFLIEPKIDLFLIDLFLLFIGSASRYWRRSAAARPSATRTTRGSGWC
jgi:nicotinamide riboside transporter PnuC